MDCAAAAHGKLDTCTEPSGDDNEMNANKSRYSRKLCTFGLIIGTALIALVITAVLNSSRPGASFVAKVKKAGGFVEYQEHGPRWLRSLLGENYPFKSATMVTFGPGTTDDDLVDIGSLPDLTFVSLTLTKVKGPGITYLKSLPKLETLELPKSRVSDDGLQYLEGLQGLKSLSLAWLDITDQGVEHLRSLKGLQRLGLSHTKVTDQGLQVLGSLSITWLDVRWTSVTADGIAQLHKKKGALNVFGP
jgi:Leucine Rich repeat